MKLNTKPPPVKLLSYFPNVLPQRPKISPAAPLQPLLVSSRFPNSQSLFQQKKNRPGVSPRQAGVAFSNLRS